MVTIFSLGVVSRNKCTILCRINTELLVMIDQSGRAGQPEFQPIANMMESPNSSTRVLMNVTTEEIMLQPFICPFNFSSIHTSRTHQWGHVIIYRRNKHTSSTVYFITTTLLCLEIRVAFLLAWFLPSQASRCNFQVFGCPHLGSKLDGCKRHHEAWLSRYGFFLHF